MLITIKDLNFKETTPYDFYIKYESLPNLTPILFNKNEFNDLTITYINQQITKETYGYNWEDVYGYLLNDKQYLNPNYKPNTIAIVILFN